MINMNFMINKKEKSLLFYNVIFIIIKEEVNYLLDKKEK
jgi:hypothetical protein